MKFYKVIDDRDLGEMQLYFWGRAWRRYHLRETVLLPIPLNLLASGIRELWLRMRLGIGSRDQKIYSAGFNAGREMERRNLELAIRSRVIEEIGKLKGREA